MANSSTVARCGQKAAISSSGTTKTSRNIQSRNIQRRAAESTIEKRSDTKTMTISVTITATTKTTTTMATNAEYVAIDSQPGTRVAAASIMAVHIVVLCAIDPKKMKL